MLWRYYEHKTKPAFLTENEVDLVLNEELSRSMINDSYIKESKFFRDEIILHLKESEHPISGILATFSLCLAQYISEQLTFVRNCNTTPRNTQVAQMHQLINYIKTEVDEFIDVISKTIKLFYSKVSPSLKMLDKHSIHNFLLNKVFGEGDLHSVTIDLLSFIHLDKMTQLRRELDRLVSFKIEDFGIASQFCLNKSSVDSLQEFKGKSQTPLVDNFSENEYLPG